MSIIKKDRWWLAVVIAAMVIITTLPMLVGHIHQGANRVYVPRWPLTATDTSAYYSDIEQVRQGRILVANQFTSETQKPSLLQPVWIVTGWMARITGMTTPVAYQAARIVALAIFVVLLFRLCRVLTVSRPQAWWMLMFVLTSSGLGWVAAHGAQLQANDFLPYDLWVSESNTFLTLGHSALFIVSQLLIGAYFWQLWRLTTTSEKSRKWVGPSLLLLALVHPYDLITLSAVTMIWLVSLVFSKKLTSNNLKTLLIKLISWWCWVVPVVAYYFYFVFRQPAMYGWLIQNISPVNGPQPLLIGLGLLLPLAVLGAIVHRSRPDQATKFFIVWAATAIIVAVVPGFPFQRRFLNGIHIPLAILAGWGCIWVDTKLFPKQVRLWIALIIFPIFFWTNLELMAGFWQVTMTGQAPYFPVYTSKDSYTAMLWLRDHSTPDEVIFTDFWNGNTLAGLTGRTVALGHGNQTVNTRARLKDWNDFIGTDITDAQRRVMLQRLRVTWLFWTNDITQPGYYNPAADPRWQKTFSDSDTTIYKLQANLDGR